MIMFKFNCKFSGLTLCSLHKDDILLSVTTIDNGVKILANPGGQRLVKSFENHSEALRLASASSAKASNVNAASTSSAGTITNISFPDRSVSFPVMSTMLIIRLINITICLYFLFYK
ncbi:putative Topless family protein [Helianthus anomalus]